MLSVRKYTGTRSMRDYARSLGTDPKSAKTLSLPRLASADILYRNWQARGADVKVGPPLADVVRTAGRFSRQYSGGRLSVATASEQVQVDEAYEAIVYLAGIECIRRGKDQFGGPDNEIYLVVTPIDASNIVVDNNEPTVNSIVTTTLGESTAVTSSGSGCRSGRAATRLRSRSASGCGKRTRGTRSRPGTRWRSRCARPRRPSPWSPGRRPVARCLPAKLPLVNQLASTLAPLIRDIFGLADDHIGSGVKHLTYDDLRGNPPPVKEPNSVIQAKTRGEPIAIGHGPDTGEFKIHFFWETRLVTHFE
jgi:hypothetical protein